MRLCWIFIVALLPFSISSLAQTQPPAPAPTVTIKTEALNVILDVVAVDRHGNPIKNLSRNQFHVWENGHPQEIAYFEEHREIAPTQPAPNITLPEHVYSNVPRSPANDSINVLLLDALNTPVQNQLYVRQQMVSYLKQIPPGTRMAIFTLGSRLRMIQGFTADPDILLAALKSKKATADRSLLLDDPSETKLSDELSMSAPLDTPGLPLMLANLQQFEAETASFQIDLRVRYTIEAFEQLSNYLDGFPGRKNIIWFSGSFPLAINPDGDLLSPFAAARAYAADVRKATDMMALHKIAVYPIDGRGLMNLPMYDVSQSGSQYARNPTAFQRDSLKFSSQLIAEHASMDQIAESTGGKAIYDTNGLREAVAQIIHNGSNYYTIAYKPTDSNYDGKFRKLIVQADMPDVKLQYRKGYFADDPRKIQMGRSPLGTEPFDVALRHGAPDATQIIFKAQVLPADPQPDLTTDASRMGDNADKLKGPLVRYDIDWAIDTHNLSLTTTPDGVRHGEIHISIRGYDAEGKTINGITKGFRLSLSPTLYSGVMQKGLAIHESLDLPKGQAYLRLGVVDMDSNRIGATEISLSPKGK